MLFNHKQGPTPDFSCLTVFTTALCNLNCSYCYICKDTNGGLKQIDEDIKQMFENGDYITSTLDINPNNKDTIKQISLWGGEPFLKIYRFINHLEEFFINFPNINTIDVSSNFTLPDHYQRIQDLIDAVDKHYHLLNLPKGEKFHFLIQMSIDGPAEMTDFGRGKNTTKKIYENWQKILHNLHFDFDKFEIEFFTKSTFSRDTWKYVDTKEKAYQWCLELDKNLYQPWFECKEFRASYRHGLWNNAQPSEWTSEDGKKYAVVIQAFADATDKIKEDCPGFREIPSLIPEALLSIDRSIKSFNCNFEKFSESLKCKECGGGCGVFSYNLVPIPHQKYTMCHRGLFDAYTDYFNNLSQQGHLHDLATLWSTTNPKYWIFDKEGIIQIHNTINKLYEYESPTFFTDCVQQIKAFADSGIIDEKYSDMNNILPTLGYFLSNAQCIQDNFIFGGSWVTRASLEIPLMYNGVMDIVIEEINKHLQERKKEYEILDIESI